VALFFVFAGAPSAFATSSWWHLTSASRPSNIQPGQAKDEVEQVTVKATSGVFVLSPGDYEFRLLPWDATAKEVEIGLQEMYGAGNVTVTGGPGDEEGSNPYIVTFTGKLADTPAGLDQSSSVGDSLLVLGCEGAVHEECAKEIAIKQLRLGRPDGYIVANAYNLGSEDVDGVSEPFTITDKLPAGLRAVSIEGTAQLVGETTFLNGVKGNCSLSTISCSFAGNLAPNGWSEMVVGVDSEGASSGATNEVNVSGGETPPATLERPVAIGDQQPSFGVEQYELTPEGEDGNPVTQAGTHPHQLTTTFVLHQTIEGFPAGLPKDLSFKIPPGLIGNPTAVAQCTTAQFLTKVATGNPFEIACPPESIIGVTTVTVKAPNDSALDGADHHGQDYLSTMTVPLYNLEPSDGEPARFGFSAGVPVVLDTAVRTGGDYGVTVNVNNISEDFGFISTQLTFWGVPGDESHDSQRGGECLFGTVEPTVGWKCNGQAETDPPAFLSMPTSCEGPLSTSVEADSWVQPGAFQTFIGEPLAALDGCNRLPFSPSITVTPDGEAGSTPTGLNVGVHVPQNLVKNATGLAESTVKNTSVTLPAGVALNPAAADGLLACSEAEVALSSDSEATCPEASKVATVEIKTPLLPNPLVGEAYLAAQNANPFGSLVALYLVAHDPVSGVLIKLAGEVKPDPVTGQLVSTFENTPQLPFEDLTLHFFGGSRAPLGTPAQCGSYTTTASIEPWSGNAPSEASSTFDITSGPSGSLCANPLPFNPSLMAGATDIQTGAFTPFTMTMSRGDGNQNLKAVDLHMPPGLLGTLSSVKLCGEAEANAGTCGPESLIGETTVSVGLGGNPYSVTGGRVYITGPYDGAPYGLSIVNPAKAGPFNLGNVIVRAKIEVNPITAALTVATDSSGPYAIPQILDGIPLEIQHINVIINRPDFTFNPTNCSPSAITGSLTSSEGASNTLSVPFQVTNCATLAFKPQFKVSTSGRTSRANGASLDVKLTYPKAAWGTQADLKSVKVDLPKQMPSRLTTLQKACPNTVFEANPASCPADSRIGSATATTPIVPVSLSGPAYFVSYGGAKFPELVIVLSGYGVTVDLHGETFINPAGVTSSTFRTVPDVPIGSFELKLPQGPFSALGANKDLCTVKSGLKMPTVFTAQNGLVIHQSTPIGVTGCVKAKAKKAKVTHKGHKKK
jgi:hypothetical protein